MKNTPLHFLLAALLLFEAFGALYGGVSLVLSPDGTLLQMPPEWIQDTPFKNYLVPGIILTIVLGVIPVIVAYSLFFKPELPVPSWLLVFPRQHWSVSAAVYCGGVMVAWINFQLLMVQKYFWLQPAISFTGLAIIVAGVLLARKFG